MRIWNGEKLGLFITLDTETTVRPFTETPDLVTVQYATDKEQGYIRLKDVNNFFKVNDKSHFIFHNLAFDWDVLVKSHGIDFHTLLENGQLHDTMLLYKLLHLATEGFVPMKASLAHCVSTLLGHELDKDDSIRCEFGQFLGKDIEDIPEQFLTYGLEDVIYTHKLFMYLTRQEPLASSQTNLSEQIQIAGSIALNHIYKNGIGFDLEAARVKYNTLSKELLSLSETLATYGWVRGNKGIKERFDDIIRFLNLDVPTTDTGNFSTKEEDLRDYKGNHFVDTYLEFITIEKTLSFIKEIVKAHS